MTFDLTQTAKEDLVQIYDFGAETWGDRQAEDYFRKLYAQFAKIADDPRRYPVVSHIGQNYRRCVFGSHAIYFEVLGETILILGIIRSQDTARIK